MKRIKKTVTEVMLVVVFVCGLILCMCETSNFTTQVYVSLAGVALMVIVVLACILKEWRETWQMN